MVCREGKALQSSRELFQQWVVCCHKLPGTAREGEVGAGCLIRATSRSSRTKSSLFNDKIARWRAAFNKRCMSSAAQMEVTR